MTAPTPHTQNDFTGNIPEEARKALDARLWAALQNTAGSMPPTAPAFPLDAEQIVRGIAFVLTRVLNAGRAADAPKADEAKVLLDLGEAMGVAIPILDEDGRRRPAPCAVRTTTGRSASPSSQDLGEADA